MSATPFLYDFDTLSNLEQDFLKNSLSSQAHIFNTNDSLSLAWLLLPFDFGQSNTAT